MPYSKYILGLVSLICVACSAERATDPGPTTTDRDSGVCGSQGTACCANDSCGSGLTCTDGVCQQGRAGDVGKTCTRNGDCGTGICVPIGPDKNVCTANCSDARDCVSGWSCAALQGSASDVCQCSPTTERCDGLDNDCDGIVDNQPAVNNLCVEEHGTGNLCLAGSCQLPGCTTSADCLGAQICDPETRHCVVPQVTDGGPHEEDAGFDAGTPDGGPRDAGTPDAGSTDGGSGQSCLSKYECGFNQKCSSGRCTGVTTGTSCSGDSQCGRGQYCSSFGQCQTGCVTAQDCTGSAMCSQNTCVTCGTNAPCPSGQYCSTSNGTPVCTTSPTCSTSSDCASTAPGTLCSSGRCRNCSSSSDCQSSPYGSTYTCSSRGLCTAPVSCDIAECSTRCYATGYICDTSDCGCMGTANCNNAQCGGVQCGPGTDCDANTCTCTQNSACSGASLSYCSELFMGFSLCALQSGTCDANCNCSSLSSCSSNSSCMANQICVDSGCADIAVDSLGRACTLAKCRQANHPCKNANTGAGCICSSANGDGFSGTTSPVACD